MELNQIKYFLHLSDTLNFTEAARMSGISQPSLTKSIQRLEDELGGPLIYRDGKDTRLTALGRDIQVEFMRVDQLIGGIQELAENSVLGKRRVLSVGIGPTIATMASAGFWGHVLRQLPTTELNFLPMLADEDETDVLSGKFDMALLPNPPDPNFKLTALPLYREALRLAVPPDHHLANQQSVSPQEMSEEPYLDRLNCEFRTQLIQHFMDRNIVMRPRIQSEREDWIQDLVAAGLGVCSLPERSKVNADLVLLPVDGLDIGREVTLVAVSGSGNPREVRQILDLARSWDW